jgi:small-conductance mechanosensitive channel
VGGEPSAWAGCNRKPFTHAMWKWFALWGEAVNISCMETGFFLADWWQIVFWGNTLQAYAKAAIYLLILWGVFFVIQRIILVRLDKLAQRTVTGFDDMAIKVVRSIKPPIVFVLSIYIAVQALTLTSWMNGIIHAVAIIVLSTQVIFILQILLDYMVRRRLERNVVEDAQETRQDKRNVESALRVINQLGRFTLWSVGVLFVLSNLGIDITSLIASLGIGGIAVALAAQNILGDLFSSLAIYFDKPFVVGDFIITGDTMGTVKNIGIKTTRIKALSGEEIVLPNQKLTSARIQNYKRMEERRVSFKVGVTYQTLTEKLGKIPQVVEEAINEVENTRFSRAHFASYGDSALIFEIVYFVTDKDYGVFMDAQQAINLSIKKRFEDLGIEFAYPTQTIHIAK